ncbi:MAG: iron chelate uptake ABC transporter family permease subunit [Candidatus Omnitrophota bacterium]|nr:iron chelate uptake ABC transporter family permease subunit [Candidatus Omnitrophota bacterium]
MDFLEIVKASFLRNALMALLITSSFLSYLGVYVVLKRIVFAGIAISQIASLGYVLGMLLKLNPQICSLGTSLIGAVLFSFHTREKRFSRESMVGLGYALSSSLGILFVAKSATAEAGMLNLLFGNVLMISSGKVCLVAAISLLIFIFYSLFNKEIAFIAFDEETARAQGLNARLFELLFYLLLAVGISAAISIIGALLSFSFLTVPALCGLCAAKRFSGVFKAALLCGIISSLLGLYLSYYCDLPTGPAVVTANIALFAVIFFLKSLR